MFTANATSEMPLLIFTLLVPLALCAIGVQALAQSTVADEDALKKTDSQMVVPIIVLAIGLIASFFHLSSLGHVFGMVDGLGRSPLTNEIAVAGVAIVTAAAYWIFAMAKHPAAAQRKIWGIVVIALGVLTAIMVGVAYMIPTVPTWNSPWGICLELGIGLAGGASLASAVLASGKIDARKLSIVSIVGAALAIIAVIGLLSAAGAAVPSSGMMIDMNGAMGFVGGAIVLIAAGAVLQFMGARKGSSGMLWAGFVCVLIGLCLARMVFYGSYSNVGLTM